MNLYEILEVSETASKDIIEKVYKIKVKKYHPDIHKPENRAAAEEKMKEINEAYEILSDDYKRKQYDDMLAQERNRVNINQNYNTYANNMYQNQYQYQYSSQSNIWRQKNEEDVQAQIKSSTSKLKILVIVLVIIVSIDFISNAIYKFKNRKEVPENEITEEQMQEYEERMEEIFRQYE